MRYFLVGLLFFSTQASIVLAYDIFVTEVEKPYAIIPLELDIEDKQTHLGELNDYPIMYEFTVESGAVLNASLDQKYTGNDPIPLALIVVRKNDADGGVSEILRFKPRSDDWQKIKDAQLGMSFWRTETISHQLEVGTYRIEVSTPDNIGSYALNLGDYSRNLGYWEKLGNTRIMQKHFGYSVMGILKSSLVYYPLGIFLLFLLMYKTWKYRKLITNAS